MDASPRIAILGVTGFIGRGLPDMLARHGFSCTGINRAGNGSVPGVDRWQRADALDLAGHHAVINLAGAPINRYWTEAYRRQLRESRVGVTQRVVAALGALPPESRPQVLINASAVGIYGDRGDEQLTETSAPGTGFLADLCQAWEAAAQEAASLGLRVVLLRTAVVLGRDGGAFPLLRRVFHAGLGGRLGSGRQWMPWIHLADHRAALLHALLNESLRGPLNLVAGTERNRDFTRKLSAALDRPAIANVPAFALKLALDGLGASLLCSERVQPAALHASGFQFRYPSLDSALAELVD